MHVRDLAEVIGVRFGFNRSLNAALSFGRFVNPKARPGTSFVKELTT
jgi:hypothetical protein